MEGWDVESSTPFITILRLEHSNQTEGQDLPFLHVYEINHILNLECELFFSRGSTKNLKKMKVL